MHSTELDFISRINFFNHLFAEASKCKHCGGHSQSIANGPFMWCCEQAREEHETAVDTEQISRLSGRGYIVIKKNDKTTVSFPEYK